MSEFYWELVQRDGTVIEIPPKLVDVVKRRMANKEAINTRNAVIPFAQIDKFRVTSKLFNAQPLIEAASQAFREPIYNPDDSIQVKWVKKAVTQPEYARRYASSTGYKRLPDENGMAVVAFVVATHLIDATKVTELTEDEIKTVDTM